MSGESGMPDSQEPKVFICYRREETAAHAGRLYDAMVSRFGEGNVFMDVDLAPGVDFVDRITAVVAACQVLIVVMGPDWATAEDEKGASRLADPEDFVRLEVETGLSRADVTPIPVLVPGAQMPKRDDLPAEMQAITRRNALELSEARWRYDVDRLNSTLDELLANIAAAPRSSVADDDAGARAPAPAPAAGASGGAVPSTGDGRRRWLLLGAAALAAIAIVFVLAIGGGGGTCGPACVIETASLSTDPEDCTRLQTQRYLEQTTFRTGQAAIDRCRKNIGNTAYKADSVEVSDVRESGGTATAKASLQGGLYDGQTKVLALVAESGQWKLDQLEGFEDFDVNRYSEAFEENAPYSPDELTHEEAECIADRLNQIGSSTLEDAILSGDVGPFGRAFSACGA